MSFININNQIAKNPNKHRVSKIEVLILETLTKNRKKSYRKMNVGGGKLIIVCMFR